MKTNPSYIDHVWHTVVLLGAIFLSVYLVDLWVDIDQVQQAMAKYPFWAPCIAILLKISTIIVAPLSGAVLYSIAGTIFPIAEAALYMTIGNFLGITFAFYLGKRYGDTFIKRGFSQTAVKQVHSAIDRMHNRKSFFVVRIVLFPLEDLLNFAAGMSRLPYVHFILISLFLATIQMILILGGIDIVVGRVR